VKARGAVPGDPLCLQHTRAAWPGADAVPERWKGGMQAAGGETGRVAGWQGRGGCDAWVPLQPCCYPWGSRPGWSSELGAAGSSLCSAASAERSPRGDTERSEPRSAVSPESVQMRS